MKTRRKIKICAYTAIAFCTYHLIGAINYKQFFLMFKGFSLRLLVFLYVFTVVYGIGGVYCGFNLLKYKDWARKGLLIVFAASLTIGAFYNRAMLAVYHNFLFSADSGVLIELVEPTYRYAVSMMILVTIVELAFMIFLTRPSIRARFIVKDRP